jgi:hypothetical protein
MIGQIGIGVLGFLSIGLLNGILGGGAFYGIALIAGILFLRLIVRHHHPLLVSFLIGFCLALDFTSTTRSGLGMLFGACVLGLSYGIPPMLRFTTPLAQVIVGLFLMVILYSFLPFGFAGVLRRLLLLIPVFLGLAAYSWITFRGISDTSYEII